MTLGKEMNLLVKRNLENLEDLAKGCLYKSLSGQRLTREEFYIARALGLVTSVPCVDDLNEFEVFDLFHVQSEKRQGYLDGEVKPLPPGKLNPDRSYTKPGRLQTGLNVGPEEIKWEDLRPEQQEFFKIHFPKIAGRFKRKGKTHD